MGNPGPPHFHEPPPQSLDAVTPQPRASRSPQPRRAPGSTQGPGVDVWGAPSTPRLRSPRCGGDGELGAGSSAGGSSHAASPAVVGRGRLPGGEGGSAPTPPPPEGAGVGARGSPHGCCSRRKAAGSLQGGVCELSQVSAQGEKKKNLKKNVLLSETGSPLRAGTLLVTERRSYGTGIKITRA